jgi:hypothetical protein
MRLFVLASLVVLLAILPARAQIADPDTLYDAGSLAFDYAQTPFPFYAGSFAAAGEGLLPDGTLPPGATEAVGGGSALAAQDTVVTAIYGLTANADGTYDAALVALRTVGPLTAGSYPVDLTGGTAIFGFIDDAAEFDLPDTMDTEVLLQWIQDLPAAHKLISTSGSIQVAEASADTLHGSFEGTTLDIDSIFFLVNVSDGQFALSGADQPTAAPPLPAAATPIVRAWPNPFNPRTSVAFSLARPQEVEAAVFDLAGRRVRTLHRGPLEAGEHRFAWNGDRRGGERVPAGVYLLRVAGAGWRSTAKLTLAP